MANSFLWDSLYLLFFLLGILFLHHFAWKPPSFLFSIRLFPPWKGSSWAPQVSKPLTGTLWHYSILLSLLYLLSLWNYLIYLFDSSPNTDFSSVCTSYPHSHSRVRSIGDDKCGLKGQLNSFPLPSINRFLCVCVCVHTRTRIVTIVFYIEIPILKLVF